MTIKKPGPNIELLNFKGQSDSRVLIIAGVHGSEQSGVEVVQRLINILSTEKTKPRYSVTIVLVLFPDNYEKALKIFFRRLRNQNPRKLGDNNDGRYTEEAYKKDYKDPNRQFPKIGEYPIAPKYEDSTGKKIEEENLFLIRLIDQLKPTRIISVHSKSKPGKPITISDHPNIATKKQNLPGVFVDPVTSLSVNETRKDPLTSPPKSVEDNIALEAAKFIKNKQKEAQMKGLVKTRYKDDLFDDWVSGNWIIENTDNRKSIEAKEPITRYANAKSTEPGFSLGEWGPRAVTDKKHKREGIPVFTIEVRRQYPSTAYLPLYCQELKKVQKGLKNQLQKDFQNYIEIQEEHMERVLELQAHAEAIRYVLLEK